MNQHFIGAVGKSFTIIAGHMKSIVNILHTFIDVEEMRKV
jgi:hypothetical protein